MPQHNITLTSYRGNITLIPPVPSDDEAIAALRTHPLSRQYLRYMPETFTAQEACARREKRAQDDTILDFYIYHGQKLAGMCGLFDMEDSAMKNACEVGILISPEFHRGGLATDVIYTLLKYAFEERKFHRAVFQTGIDNVGMRGLLENVAGAVLESTARGSWKDGPAKYIDVVGYSILEPEWTNDVKSRLEARMSGRK